MQKSYQKIRIFILFSFFYCGFNPIAWANYDEALQAYDNKDYKTAFREFSLLAEQGNSKAQSSLGVMYANAQGVSKDERQAVLWLSKAAEQGDPNAQFNLGGMYGRGEGVAKNEKQSTKYYRMAAEQGYKVAQYNLGFLYANGVGVAKDDQQAAVWYLKAAEQGDLMGQIALGWMYENGKGVSKDIQQAYFWWLLAGAQGDENAKHNLAVVEKFLLPQQLAQALSDARNWRPKTARQVAKIGLPDGDENNSGSDSTRPKTKIEKLSGTGFVVSSNKVVTNVHVVEGCAVLKVNGEHATIRAMDTANDLALLNTSLNSDVASLGAGKLRQGDEINAVGFPLHGLLASGAQITSGNVSALAGMQNDSRFIQISAPVQPGNSGGPLVDASGNVVGVIVSKLNAVAIASMNGDIPQNINFAISPLVLKSFLEANQVKYKTAASNKNLSTANVMGIAKRYTVLVECIK